MGEEVFLYSLLLIGVIWISGNAERTQKIVNSIKKKKGRGGPSVLVGLDNGSIPWWLFLGKAFLMKEVLFALTICVS